MDSSTSNEENTRTADERGLAQIILSYEDLHGNNITRTANASSSERRVYLKIRGLHRLRRFGFVVDEVLWAKDGRGARTRVFNSKDEPKLQKKSV
jgi:hypothetical protein